MVDVPVLVAVAALAEIVVFVAVGGAIGVLPAIGLLLATSVIGFAVLRGQGGRAFLAIGEAMRARRDPQREIAQGLLVTVAGLLLVIPGFLTDLAGLVLLAPPVRALVGRRAARRTVHPGGPVRAAGPAGSTGSLVVDAPAFEVHDAAHDSNHPRN